MWKQFTVSLRSHNKTMRSILVFSFLRRNGGFGKSRSLWDVTQLVARPQAPHLYPGPPPSFPERAVAQSLTAPLSCSRSQELESSREPGVLIAGREAESRSSQARRLAGLRKFTNGCRVYWAPCFHLETPLLPGLVPPRCPSHQGRF